MISVAVPASSYILYTYVPASLIEILANDIFPSASFTVLSNVFSTGDNSSTLNVNCPLVSDTAVPA